MLDAQNLSKAYGDKQVLTNVSFQIAPGEIVGIMGPSGQGKSTIARILCGTVLPDTGSVTFAGEPLIAPGQAFNPKLRTAIQMIPQQPFASLDPRQTIGSAIAEPLLFHGIQKSRSHTKIQAMTLMQRMLLDPRLYARRPDEISGGQAQRVLIARSLAVSPRLLIADEATSMLDISSQAQIMDLLRALNKKDGLSILIISHDYHLIKSVAHRIYRLSSEGLESILEEHL